MAYPTIHPFNNAPVDPIYSYWQGNTASLVIGFCSPGAAVPFPADGTPLNNPQDWQDGTMWQLVNPPIHWTGNCWTGYTVMYVGDDGKVYTGNAVYAPTAHWAGGYIFKDLPNVKVLGIGYNLFWNGSFFDCSISFTDFGGRGKYSGINGRSGAVYPNVFGQASKGPVPPYWSIPACSGIITYPGDIVPVIVFQSQDTAILALGSYVLDQGPCGTIEANSRPMPDAPTIGLQSAGANLSIGWIYSPTAGGTFLPIVVDGAEGCSIETFGTQQTPTILEPGKGFYPTDGLAEVVFSPCQNCESTFVHTQNGQVISIEGWPFNQQSCFFQAGIHNSIYNITEIGTSGYYSTCPDALAFANYGGANAFFEGAPPVPANYSYPVWVGSAMPANNQIFGTDNTALTYLTPAGVFSEVPMSNNYSLYVFTLAG